MSVLTCQFALAAVNRVPEKYPTIQAAIDACVDGDQVVVAPGVYTGDGNRDIRFSGKAITVRSDDPNDPDIVMTTVVDCNGTEEDQHCGFVFNRSENPDSVLSGLTITRGCNGRGGAIYCYDYASPSIINCRIVGNSASSGGGMVNWGSDATVINTIFSGNVANNQGGGLYNIEGHPAIINCNFINNSANDAGGLYSMVYNPTITNCIIWGNSPDQVGGFAYSLDITYSCVQDGWLGLGNIDADPLFVDLTNGDYHLTFQSPCRGSG